MSSSEYLDLLGPGSLIVSYTCDCGCGTRSEIDLVPLDGMGLRTEADMAAALVLAERVKKVLIERGFGEVEVRTRRYEPEVGVN